MDMYKNKLTRFIGDQCYLLGSYSGDYNESCQQAYEGFIKYGLFNLLKSYHINTGIMYLNKKRFPHSKQNVRKVIKRIFRELTRK